MNGGSLTKASSSYSQVCETKNKEKHLKMERSRALFLKKKKKNIFEMQCCKRIWREKVIFNNMMTAISADALQLTDMFGFCQHGTEYWCYKFVQNSSCSFTRPT